MRTSPTSTYYAAKIGIYLDSVEAVENGDGGPGAGRLKMAAQRLAGMAIGWEPRALGLRGLLVAAPLAGRLRYVANPTHRVYRPRAPSPDGPVG